MKKQLVNFALTFAVGSLAQAANQAVLVDVTGQDAQIIYERMSAVPVQDMGDRYLKAARGIICTRTADGYVNGKLRLIYACDVMIDVTPTGEISLSPSYSK